jgi:hypothetical protein
VGPSGTRKMDVVTYHVLELQDVGQACLYASRTIGVCVWMSWQAKPFRVQGSEATQLVHRVDGQVSGGSHLATPSCQVRRTQDGSIGQEPGWGRTCHEWGPFL